MSVISIISIAILSLIVVGILIGIIRGWKKSLARFVILLVSLIVSLFVSPAISNVVISNFTSGTTLTVASFSVDFKEVLNSFLNNEQMVDDMLSANSTTTELAKSVMNVAINIALFLAIFLIIAIFSLIIYWIVCLILHSKAKKHGTLTPKKAANRLCGGLLGALSMIVIGFALLTPVFGVMNICDKFLAEESTSASATTITASASSPTSLVCSELFYTDSKEIGKVETYVETYAKIREEYNSSAMGKVFNSIGVSKLGTLGFNYLTTVEQGSLKVNLTDEFVSIIGAYNLYKENFVKNSFDITSVDSIDGIIEIFEQAEKSEIVKSYLTEFIPKFCERWEAGETFLGISCPVQGEYNKVFLDALQILKTNSYDRISSNILTILKTVKVANADEHQAIKKIRDEKMSITDFLENDKTFVQDVIVSLASTNEFKNNLPVISGDALEILYKQIISNETSFDDNRLTNEEIAAIDWNKEGETIGALTSKILSVYSSTKGSGSDASAMTDQLTTIGEVIDLSRKSAMLSKPLQTFLIGFVQSESFTLDEKIKTKVEGYLTDKWNSETFEFATMFGTIQEASQVAKNVLNSGENISLGDLKEVISTIIDNDDVKDTIKDLITDNVITQMFPSDNSGTSEILTDMLGTFLDNTNSKTLEKDIAAGEKIVDIVSQSNNNEGKITLDGEDKEAKQATANQLVADIAASDAIMSMIESANDTSGENTAAIKSVIGNLSDDGDVSYIKESIKSLPEESISNENREILANLFGVDLNAVSEDKE